MSLPHLLLVDDSQAILSYEIASLSGYYTMSTALTGIQALDLVKKERPAAVLLDLSMPGMDGDEVLAIMTADPALAKIPVIVVSSEHARAVACMKAGAKAYLPKPIRADELRVTVARVLEQAQRAAEEGSLAILPVTVGTLDFAVPLDSVRLVTLQPATVPVVLEGERIGEAFALHGEPLAVAELAGRLSTAHTQPLLDRKILVLSGQARVGVCVDEVRMPRVVLAAAVDRSESVVRDQRPVLHPAVVASVRLDEGSLPVVEPLRLFPDVQLLSLSLAAARALAAAGTASMS